MYDTLSAFRRPRLVYLPFGWCFKKIPQKVSGGIASQAPLGRSLCRSQEASPARRYRVTRLYTRLPIDGARPNLNVQKERKSVRMQLGMNFLHWRSSLLRVAATGGHLGRMSCSREGGNHLVNAHTCPLLLHSSVQSSLGELTLSTEQIFPQSAVLQLLTSTLNVLVFPGSRVSTEAQTQTQSRKEQTKPRVFLVSLWFMWEPGGE